MAACAAGLALAGALLMPLYGTAHALPLQPAQVRAQAVELVPRGLGAGHGRGVLELAQQALAHGVDSLVVFLAALPAQLQAVPDQQAKRAEHGTTSQEWPQAILNELSDWVKVHLRASAFVWTALVIEHLALLFIVYKALNAFDRQGWKYCNAMIEAADWQRRYYRLHARFMRRVASTRVED